ncbi:MAG TPA: DUF6491 family protein [Rhizomicrobium sp.]
MKKVILLAAALCIGASPALAKDSICIRQDDIYNWKALSDKQVVLESNRHQKALLKLVGTCSDLGFSEALEIRSPGATGLSCVSVGDTVINRGGIGGPHGRCSIISVTPYTAGTTPASTTPPADGNH